MWYVVTALASAGLGAFVMAVMASGAKQDAADEAFALGRTLGIGEGIKQAERAQRAKDSLRATVAAATRKRRLAELDIIPEGFDGQGTA